MLDALTFCDLTTGPDGSAVSVEDRLSDVLARYGPDDPVHRAVDAAREELLAAVGRVRGWL
ncbi:metal dependent phosphohydrolase [Mycobacterium intracellulare subsp. yongonense 05-1390]|uniref:Metal dependent phosphohydrolase n=1 Tax=Mycobacterium indicus pranii (strain DSM 45239 / MTCC 9506) TaxID=1232724 RepID=J9WGR9_MYCIP|nr:Metal dependent phosphohydrolase [Mycobacterium intracellulare subsp. intracellulare MTCC 9506]AGP64826.1 metal dependent phosphohydrolase [Mycobacterium intracellulare subsp. yongonense 05-1390]